MRVSKESKPVVAKLWNGKVNNFTQSFQNSMYVDTRINSMHLRFEREKHHQISLNLKEKKKLDVFNEFKTKTMILKYFKKKFNVHAHFSDVQKFSHQQLERILVTKGLRKKKKKAAVLIQKCYRGHRGRMSYKEILELRETAVGKIIN
jgi:hypothetical protein